MEVSYLVLTFFATPKWQHDRSNCESATHIFNALAMPGIRRTGGKIQKITMDSVESFVAAWRPPLAQGVRKPAVTGFEDNFGWASLTI